MTRKIHMMAGAALAVLTFAPGLAAHAAAAASSAAASDKGVALEEVIVTATKTGNTNLQKTALSVSVVGGDDLVKSNIRGIKDLTLMVPSLTVTTNNINPQIYIRGVGGFQGLEGDVSFYSDGVYLSRPSMILQGNFNDIERIEVLEGPQGTVFGRNSNGGAINFISKAPTRKFSFENTFQTGNYALLDDSLSVSGPITENVQARLSVSHLQHDGYQINVVPGVGNPDAANRWAARGTLRWEITSDLTSTTRADGLNTHERWATNNTFLSPTIGLGFVSPTLNSINGDLKRVAVNTVPYEDERAYGISEELEWKLNEHFILKSISAARSDYSKNPQDSLSEVRYSGGLSLYLETQYSQEFNLINNFGPFSGVVGVYYFKDRTKQTGVSIQYGGNIKTPNPAGGTETFQITKVPVTSKAVFFEETWHATPTLGFTFGARYTEDEKGLITNNATFTLPAGFVADGLTYLTGGRPFTTLAAPAVNPFIANLSQSENAVTPKFAINWQLTPDAMVYVSASKGFKSGGFSPTARSLQGASFQAEYMKAYEVGAKTDWFDHTLRLNAALFRYDWKGQQFNALIAPQVSAVANSGGSTLNGFEGSVLWRPTQGLTLNANLTLLSTEYTDFPKYSFPGAFKTLLAGDPNYNVATATYNAKGKKLVNAPPTSVNLSAQKDWELAGGAGLYLRGEYSYSGRIYFDPTNLLLASRAPINQTNGSFGYTPPNGHWDFSVWVKNLTDQRYINGINGGSTITAPVSAPRTYGIRINYEY